MMLLEMVYIGCAATGLFALALQIVLSLFGLGDGDDLDGHDVDHGDSAFGWLSLRTISAFLAFFGLTGWWLASRGWSPVSSALVSMLAGGLVGGLLTLLVSQRKRLDSEGTLDPANAVGCIASVYLRIPAKGKGMGKIQVKVQGRTAEFQAVSDGVEIPTGAVVRVERMITADTFAVAPAGGPRGDD